MNKPLIDVRSAFVKYRSGTSSVLALNDVSFEASAGEKIAVMGPSGGGKSTFLNLIAGSVRAARGEYHLRGQRICTLGPPQLARVRSDLLGFVFQDARLVPHLSIEQNILLSVEHLGHRTGWTEKLAAISAALGINELLGRFPHALSGGQAQRAAIARAILKAPPVLLADEPTGSLDDDTGHRAISAIFDFCRDSTIIVATHSKSVAQMCDRIVRIEHGRMMA
jgi:ABC-type lipoprotein export system ATPase subunit